MKKRIIILGSTGSIGKTTLKIIKENKNKFSIKLLSTNKNIKKIYEQSKKFNVKNVIIHDLHTYKKSKCFFNKNGINVFNTIVDYKKKNKVKVNYTMNAIIGISGLKPTLDIIRSTENIAIANKESIICGWNLIKKKLTQFKTKFIPIDSEHFSIFELIKNENKENIDKIYITASGGPFLKTNFLNFKKFNQKNAIKHPTWKMGKKISIDSATLINKIYELIEAKKIFNFDYTKFEILIQPTSYIHGIVDFKTGISKILSHPTSMKIPIYNSLLNNNESKYLPNKINIDLMNNLKFQKINKKNFPIEKLLNLIPKSDSLFETVFVSANDTLVELFLDQKIKFFEIYKFLFKILRLKEFQKFKKLIPQNVTQIGDLSSKVRLKTIALSVKSRI